MQDKLHILEDLNMLYIRQIALSLEVLCPGHPGCSAAGRCCFQRGGECLWVWVSMWVCVGVCISIYMVAHFTSAALGGKGCVLAPKGQREALLGRLLFLGRGCKLGGRLV